MAYEDDIKKMYDEYYKSQYDTLVKNKNNSLNQLAGQDSLINNTYTDTQNQINKNKSDTANKYKDMYTQLDNAAASKKNEYYGDRNQVALQNARNNQAIRDYMAKNNLLASGENVDALLRSKTDFNNSIGNIYGAEQAYNKNVSDTRSRYQGDEASAYVNYDNALAAALKERDRQLSTLATQRKGIEDNFNTDNSSLLSEIEAKRMKDINDYRERLRQEELQRQQELEAWNRQVEERKRQEAIQAAEAERDYQRQLSLASSRSYGSSSTSDSDLINSYESDLLSNTRSGNLASLDTSLQAANDLYAQGYINSSKYNDYSASLRSSLATNALAQQKIDGGLYGYSGAYRQPVTTQPVTPVLKTTGGGSKKTSLAY